MSFAPRAAFSVLAAALSLPACGARSSLEGDLGAGSDMGGSGGAPAASTHAASSASSASAVSTGSASMAASSSAASATSSSTGGSTSSGCSDGTREGFLDEAVYPLIAACSGGWSIPGILTATAPRCGHLAGNDSANPTGLTCGAADLCAPGFHVCAGAEDVARRSPTGCEGAQFGPDLFFATRQGSTGCAICATGSLEDSPSCTGCSCARGCATSPLTANDLFGCGSRGGRPIAASCGVLDRFSDDLCGAIGSMWNCRGDGCNEANVVTKTSDEGGGVLCCAD
ncbi:hypothetical protein WMF45_29320 [Sorangium sp. So ce448]|uniref:hypothetical protein n=1 Tax=Sorangium sp. So ce448 TaxID=3133314 RepID=UPI003F63EF69